MAESEFLYRPILEHVTDVVNEQGFDPYEAYAWLYEQQVKQGLHAETYCSSSITSGGHARDETLAMGEIIARNTESASLLAEQLAADGQLDAAAAIEPVFVGKTFWNQAQYMEFWHCVIGGYDLTSGFMARDVNQLRADATTAFERASLDFDLMISVEDAEARASEYFKMSSAFASLITGGTEAHPIETIIRMVDTDTSLGAQTERAFARQIGSKVMNISVLRPASTEDLAAVNHRLAADTARLIRFGATVFDTRNNKTRLVLTEDAA